MIRPWTLGSSFMALIDILEWLSMSPWAPQMPGHSVVVLCRSDRALHTSARDETAGGATAAVGVSCVWRLSGGLAVHGGDLQGHTMFFFFLLYVLKYIC